MTKSAIKEEESVKNVVNLETRYNRSTIKASNTIANKHSFPSVVL